MTLENREMLARAEYLIMKYAIEIPTELRALVSPHLELLVNEANHELEWDELIDLLEEMFSSRTLVAHTRSRGCFTPSATEIAAALEEPIAELPHRDPLQNTFYTVTTPSLERFHELERQYGEDAATPELDDPGLDDPGKDGSMRLLHTMLRVGDLDRSLAFYTEILGMQLLRKKEYPGGRFTLAFVGYGPESQGACIELTHNWDTGSYQVGDGYGHIALEVEDAYKACEDIKNAGGNVTREAGPMKHGTTVIAFVEDPDGYKIELIQKKTTS